MSFQSIKNMIKRLRSQGEAEIEEIAVKDVATEKLDAFLLTGGVYAKDDGSIILKPRKKRAYIHANRNQGAIESQDIVKLLHLLGFDNAKEQVGFSTRAITIENNITVYAHVAFSGRRTSGFFDKPSYVTLNSSEYNANKKGGIRFDFRYPLDCKTQKRKIKKINDLIAKCEREAMESEVYGEFTKMLQHSVRDGCFMGYVFSADVGYDDCSTIYIFTKENFKQVTNGTAESHPYDMSIAEIYFPNERYNYTLDLYDICFHDSFSLGHAEETVKIDSKNYKEKDFEAAFIEIANKKAREKQKILEASFQFIEHLKNKKEYKAYLRRFSSFISFYRNPHSCI